MALSANAPYQHETGIYNQLPANAEHIYEGSMCSRLTTGYVGVLTAGERFVGHAQAEADNSAGTAGDIDVTLLRGEYYLEVTLASVAITDVGKPVYASDDATVTLTKGANTLVGIVHRYVTTDTCVVKFIVDAVDAPASYEFDCQASADSAAHILIHGIDNPRGLIITSCFARITEVMAGGTEDQGIVTVRDESNNTIATLTPSDAGADALNDVVEGYFLYEASTGAAHIVVAAGEYVDGTVTQETSGTAAAGKMVVYVEAIPLI